VVDGLKGLAECPTLTDKGRELARQLLPKIHPKNLTFPQQVDTLWSLCALKEYDNKAVSGLCDAINELSFERVDNDLQYEEFLKVVDIYNALELEAPANLKLTNKALTMAVKGKELLFAVKYKEGQTTYDPFKQRVVQGLAKGLTEASINHQLIMEEELYNQ